MGFGHAFKKEHFPLSDNQFVPVNHGSFGLSPQIVMDKFRAEVETDLASPDSFIRIQQPKEYLESIKIVADFLNCPYRNLALVTNATTAVNTVLRSIPFSKGDVVAIPSTTYGACANTVKFLAETIGIEIVVVNLALPMLHEAIVDAFRQTFDAQKVKLALFDTVSSMPGAKMPYLELTRLCKEYNVLSMVDGAHSIGLIPLDFSEFSPDFYTSNLHKWLYVPRPCAVLYVDPKHHRTVQTNPVSHSYVSPNAVLSKEEEENLLVSKFTFTGSISFASISCIKTALQFRNDICGGEEAIHDHCLGMARKVADLVLRKWPGASIIENEEKSLVTAMVTVYFPIENYSPSFDASDPELMLLFVNKVSELQIEKHHTFVPFASHAGKVVARFSCQVYNELSDYEYACDAVHSAVKAFFALKL